MVLMVLVDHREVHSSRHWCIRPEHFIIFQLDAQKSFGSEYDECASGQSLRECSGEGPMLHVTVRDEAFHLESVSSITISREEPERRSENL